MVEASRGVRGHVSVYYADLRTRERLEVDSERVHKAASIIKVPILVELYRQILAGRVRGDAVLTVRPEDKVGGTGALHGRKPPYRIRLAKLAELMITRSDNTATNVIINRVTMRAVNREMRKRGLTATQLQRKMVHKPPPENFTSARDMGQLLEVVAQRRIPTPADYEDVLTVMSRAKRGNKIGALLPADVAIARKGGALFRVFHDAAILEVGGRKIVAVVLMSGYRSQKKAKKVMQQIGLILYEHAHRSRRR